jgi:hypothetical protein
MPIRHFVPLVVPLAIAIVAALGWLADRLGVPVAPVAVIAIVGATLVTLQLEDHKLGNYLAELFHSNRGDDPLKR